jgi:DNA-binding SARP family transcriptional activator
MRAVADEPVHVRLTLLGRWRLLRSSRPIRLSRSAQRLVAFLALAGARDRNFVAGALWPESPEPRAHANLRNTLWRLRRRGVGIVTATPGEVGLRDASIDVDDLTSYATDLLNDPATPIDTRRGELLTGPGLLPGWYEDWVVQGQDRLDQLRVAALERLSARLLATRRPPLAAETARAAVRLDPLRESARYRLIHAQLAEENVAGAVREYRQFRDLLERELGIAPSGQITTLLEPYLPVGPGHLP